VPDDLSRSATCAFFCRRIRSVAGQDPTSRSDARRDGKPDVELGGSDPAHCHGRSPVNQEFIAHHATGQKARWGDREHASRPSTGQKARCGDRELESRSSRVAAKKSSAPRYRAGESPSHPSGASASSLTSAVRGGDAVRPCGDGSSRDDEWMRILISKCIGGLSDLIPHLSIWPSDGDPTIVRRVCIVCTRV
jgi:hypothetical protein